jgi:hypothetical protein
VRIVHPKLALGATIGRFFEAAGLSPILRQGSESKPSLLYFHSVQKEGGTHETESEVAILVLGN